MVVEWRLRALLDAHGITPYALAAELGSSLSRNAVYRLANTTPARVELATLAALVAALRRLTGRPIEVGDLVQTREGGRAPTTTRGARPVRSSKGDPHGNASTHE